MNKLTKIGLSALCGSLAVVSASTAGTMEVLGTATATHTIKDGETDGNPLGMKTNLSFKGSGELDGGQTFSVLIAHNDQNAWSSANITLNTNMLGSFKLSSAEGGNGIGGYDDNMPRAYEEVWDAGLSTSINLQKGVGSTMNIQYSTPPVLWGTVLKIAYAPENDGSQNNDKSTSGSNGSNSKFEGMDVVLDLAPESPVNIFLGASRTSQEESRALLEDLDGPHYEAVAGVKLSIGPIEAGGQISGEKTGFRQLNDVEYYANTSFGLALNINDSLSVSYAEIRSMQAKEISAQDGEQKITMDGESWQVAYTLGGVALKYSHSEVSNIGYSRDKDREAQLVGLSMAF